MIPVLQKAKKKPAVVKAAVMPTPIAAMSASQAEVMSALFKVFGNVHRLRILVYLSLGERTVGEIEAALHIRQPTLSQQLGILRDAELITGRRVAKAAFYALTSDRGRCAIDVVHAANGTSVALDLRKDRRRISHTHSAAVFASVFR